MRAHFAFLLLVACAACGVGALSAACFSEADNCLETDSCGAPGPDAGGVDTGIHVDAGADAGASDAGNGDAAGRNAEGGDAARGDAAGDDAASGDAAGDDAATRDGALDDGGTLDGDAQDSAADGSSDDAG